jgi:hypothetical protein
MASWMPERSASSLGLGRVKLPRQRRRVLRSEFWIGRRVVWW